MRIVMDMTIIHDTVPRGQVLGTMRKEFDSSAIPISGFNVEDSVWENATKIENVTVNFEDDCYYVALEPERIRNAGEYDQIKEMYKEHGWKALGE